jgi:sialate O-acetylesterase
MSVFNCAAIFSDNMVLQREKPVSVWGFANNWCEVEVTVGEYSAKATARRNKWEVTLPPMPVATGLTMTVKNLENTSQCITFKNVAVGEVWLAGGQSNMGVTLFDSKGGKETIAKAKEAGTAGKKDIRFYYTKKIAYMDEFNLIDERDGGWRTLSDNMNDWSAVGFGFAWEISDLPELNGCPIGILGCNWGGTLIANWISEKSLKGDSCGKVSVDEFDKMMEIKTYEGYLEEMEEHNSWFDSWEMKIHEYYVTHPVDPIWAEAERYAGEPGRYPGPLGPFSFLRPGGLYETMLSRVAPYGLKGFIYYQGESDDRDPRYYYGMMKLLIEEWRRSWRDDNLPFIFTQLPMWVDRNQEDNKAWCYIRDDQMKAFKFVKNTGLAVIADTGGYDDLHPADKAPVSHRLALQAKHFVYNTIPAAEANGPIFKCARSVENGIEIYFDYADGGFDIREKMDCFDIPARDGIEDKNTTMGEYTFEIASFNKQFIPATEVILGDGVITLKNPSIATAEYARYLFSNCCEARIFGKNGLPVAPFMIV